MGSHDEKSCLNPSSNPVKNCQGPDIFGALGELDVLLAKAVGPIVSKSKGDLQVGGDLEEIWSFGGSLAALFLSFVHPL